MEAFEFFLVARCADGKASPEACRSLRLFASTPGRDRRGEGALRDIGDHAPRIIALAYFCRLKWNMHFLVVKKVCRVPPTAFWTSPARHAAAACPPVAELPPRGAHAELMRSHKDILKMCFPEGFESVQPHTRKCHRPLRALHPLGVPSPLRCLLAPTPAAAAQPPLCIFVSACAVLCSA